MTTFNPNAATVYADGPSSDPIQPSKPQIRQLLTQYETAIGAYATGAGSTAKTTRALLYADLAHAAGDTAWVYADSTTAYNGIYIKSGASGSGSWSKILPLPYSFVIGTDLGAGTANAIQIRTDIPVADGMILAFTLFRATTASPVTIAINGGTALTLKTVRGGNASALSAGQEVWFRVRTADSTARMISDQDVAALVAQAEAAQVAAEEAAAELLNRFVPDVVGSDAAPTASFGASKNGIGYSTNTTGSSGFPDAQGLTLSFMFGGSTRAFDLWRKRNNDDLYFRGHTDTGIGNWRRMVHDGLKASTALAVDAADDTVYMTPKTTADQVDQRTTKLYGNNSIARTIPARFGDRVNLRDWLDGSGGAGSDTYNNIAIGNLIAYLNANPGKTLVGVKGDVYKISGTTQRFWPSKLRIRMDGARFQWNGTLTGTGTLFEFGQFVDCEALEMEILSGSTFRRLVDFMGNNTVVDLNIYAQSQINNEGASPLTDYAVRYRGQAQVVRRAKLTNINKAHFLYGDGGDGVPSVGSRLEDVTAISYATGLNIRNQRDCVNKTPLFKGRSPSAPIGNSGMNGIVHEGVYEYRLINPVVMDAAEHGIRFGGTRNNEQQSGAIVVSGGQIIRPAQSGLKFFTGYAGKRFNRVDVTGMQVIDCQYEPENAGALPGFNDEGFLLQQIVGGTFTGCSVSKQDSVTGYSCDCCVYISGATDVAIIGFRGDAPKRNLLRVSEWDDGSGAAPVETLDNNSVSFLDAYGNNIGEDGIVVDHPTKSIRDLWVRAEMIGSQAAGFAGFKSNAPWGRYSQPSLVELKVRNFAAGTSAFTSSGNFKIRDMFGSAY